MNKKADLNALQIVIISVVVLILLVLLTTQITSQFTSAGKIGICQASILKANLAEELTKGIAGATVPGLLSLDCNDLPDIKINKDVVVKNNIVNDDVIKQKIANGMLECWKMVGQGELDPFKKYDDDQTYCVICSDVVFDEDFVKHAKEQSPQYLLTDMNYWLASHTIPGVKTTYFEALFRQSPDTRTILEYKNKEIPFDYSKQHSIVWRLDSAKVSDTAALAAVGTGTIAAGVAGAKAGAWAGGALGSIIPVAGTTVGAVTGATLGAAGGMIGSFFIVSEINSDTTLASGVFLVPKDKLGEKLIIGSGDKKIERDFCTKLVNY